MFIKKWFGGSSKTKEKNQDSKDQEQEENDIPDDQELEQQGFDVDKIDLNEEVKDEPLIDFQNDYPGYLILDKEQIMDQCKLYCFKPGGDEIRSELGHHKGGHICSDKGVKSKMRGVGKEMVKQIGKKILSGSLNLTKISFPIKAMIPKTALETSMHITCLFPTLLNKATSLKDPLERMKLVITTCLSSFYWTNTFLKPLNPILGETLQGYFNDGTQVYGEQISHHPPVSYFYILGPGSSYKFYGYYNYEAKAGLNSLTIINKGKRYIEFTDTKQKIFFDFPNEQYSGTFVGTMKQESIGKMTFEDKTFGYCAEIVLGKIKKKPTDFFDGNIIKDGKICSKIYGTYLGFIDFDGIRYWDKDMLIPHRINFKEGDQALISDHHNRNDLITLKKGDMAFGQIEKERLEQEQRIDRKYREDWIKIQEKNKKNKKK